MNIVPDRELSMAIKANKAIKAIMAMKTTKATKAIIKGNNPIKI